MCSPTTDAMGPNHAHPGGRRLAEFLDDLNVEHLWLKGHHVVWQTGQKNAEEGVSYESHTHCSAFAAAAAMRLDIYVLRPPRHGQLYLASAQHHWLKGYRRYGGSTAAASGWVNLGRSGEAGTLARAVAAASRGSLVLASFAQAPDHSPDGRAVPMPGHVALVRPACSSASGGNREEWFSSSAPAVESDLGPEVCSAGLVDAARLAMRDVFAPHPGAWPRGVELFAHRSALEEDVYPEHPANARRIAYKGGVAVVE